MTNFKSFKVLHCCDQTWELVSPLVHNGKIMQWSQDVLKNNIDSTVYSIAGDVV